MGNLGIGIGIGVGLNRANFSWSSYWNPRLKEWLKQRSLLDFNASIGTKATILPVCGKTNGTDSYIKAPDTTKAWTFTEFTYDVYFKTPHVLPTSNRCIMGRNASGLTDGDLDIIVQYTAPNLFFRFENKTDHIQTLVPITPDTVYHIIITQNQAAGMVMYVDAEIIGTDPYRAVPAHATEPFSVGGWITAGTPGGFVDMEYYTVRVYNVCLTEPELTARWNLQDVTRGLILCWDFMGDNGSTTEHDRSGQGNHGTWVGTAPYYTYSANGCQDNLKNGYKMYRKLGAFPLYLPKLIGSNNYPESPVFPADYTLFKEVAGSLTKHNIAGSKFRFPVETVWDRSNATTNNAQSRAAAYYDAANVTDWHAWEVANYNIITSYLNTGYQGMFASKVENLADADGILRPTNIEEILLTLENQTGTALTKFLDYTNND